MPVLPWTSAAETPAAETADEMLIQVSRLHLSRVRDVPGFLLAAYKIRSATLKSPGAIGVSLNAQLLKRTFWTLSAWTDERAIRGFVYSPIHRQVMVRYGDRMIGAHFHTWSTTTSAPTGSGPEGSGPDWNDAMQRLEASTSGEHPAEPM